MTSFPVAAVNAESPAPVVFPQVVDGGGYTTEFILISTTDRASAMLSFYTEDGAPWDIEQ